MSVASNVRRCLFGPVDSSSRRMSTELSMSYADRDAQRFKEKWNFDVIRDTPLNGHYAWSTQPSSDIPPVYFKGYDCRCKRRPQQHGDVNTDDNDDGGSSAAVVSQASPVQCGNVNVVLGVSNASQKQVEDETTPPPHKSSDSDNCKRNTVRLRGRTIQSRLEDFLQTKKRSATPETESVVCSKKRRVDSS